MSGSSSEAWRMIRPPCAQDNNGSVLGGDVMLRFRPIAPKPATCPGGGLPKISAFCSERRRKRKYVRVRRNSGYTRSKNDKKHRNDCVLNEAAKEEKVRSDVALLQLLPERSTDMNRPIESDRTDRQTTTVVVVVSVQARAMVEEDNRTIRSWVTCLEGDTCPGFVSDVSGSVTWVNGALRKMVAQNDGGDSSSEVGVGLVIKERFPSFDSALTGHVKLQYYGGEARERKLYSRVVPCDVWRIMEGGGFAWRLDVAAALTLGPTY